MSASVFVVQFLKMKDRADSRWRESPRATAVGTFSANEKIKRLSVSRLDPNVN